MNKTSTDKIKSAAPFLIWFHRCLPRALPVQVRPYLEHYYQLALTSLDRCDAPQPPPVKEIAPLAGVAPQTAKQVLLALKKGGMKFAASPTQGWQSSSGEPMRSASNRAVPNAEEPSGLPVDRHQLEKLLPIASNPTNS